MAQVGCSGTDRVGAQRHRVGASGTARTQPTPVLALRLLLRPLHCNNPRLSLMGSRAESGLGGDLIHLLRHSCGSQYNALPMLPLHAQVETKGQKRNRQAGRFTDAWTDECLAVQQMDGWIG